MLGSRPPDGVDGFEDGGSRPPDGVDGFEDGGSRPPDGVDALDDGCRRPPDGVDALDDGFDNGCRSAHGSAKLAMPFEVTENMLQLLDPSRLLVEETALSKLLLAARP